MNPISLHVAEDQMEAHLRKWLKDYLGAAVASDPALDRVDADATMPLVWARADEWDPDLAFESHPLPAVFITCTGVDGEDSGTWSDGVLWEPANIGVRVVTENQRQGDQIIGCNRLTRLYLFAFKQLFAQRPFVSEQVRIEASGKGALPADQSRGLAFMDLELSATVATASSDVAWLEDPTYGEPPRVPDVPVEIESVDVTVEAA